MWSESRDVPYRNVVQWLGCGRVLSRQSAPRKQTEVFLQQQKINLFL